jgi:hypothetical protein
MPTTRQHWLHTSCCSCHNLQDVCIELDVGDATTLVTAVRKLMRVVSAVPRMEAFIAEVCTAAKPLWL